LTKDLNEDVSLISAVVGSGCCWGIANPGI
jgi:hypothetical protein